MDLADGPGLEDLGKPVTYDLTVLPHADDRARRFFGRLTLEILPRVGHCGVIVETSRGELNDANRACEIFEQCSGGEPVAILDIGGYFSLSSQIIKDRFSTGFLRRAQSSEGTRGSLDGRVGRLFDGAHTEALRRGHICRRAVVFGYGKVGRSAARALTSRGVRVSVVDTNPVRAIEASAHGFRVLEKRTGLATADLILGATGNFSLRGDDFRYVRNGCFVASVTSSDDELDLADLTQRYTVESCSAHVTCYSRQGHYFYVMNSGNAVNFIDGGVMAALGRLLMRQLISQAI